MRRQCDAPRLSGRTEVAATATLTERQLPAAHRGGRSHVVRRPARAPMALNAFARPRARDVIAVAEERALAGDCLAPVRAAAALLDSPAIRPYRRIRRAAAVLRCAGVGRHGATHARAIAQGSGGRPASARRRHPRQQKRRANPCERRTRDAIDCQRLLLPTRDLRRRTSSH
jgi:hypothetical protein